MANPHHRDTSPATDTSPTGTSATAQAPASDRSGKDAAAAVAGFAAGTVLIVCCAFTLPRLPKAVEAIGAWPVWGGFTVVTMVAGWLFWSNIQKIYTHLLR